MNLRALAGNKLASVCRKRRKWTYYIRF